LKQQQLFNDTIKPLRDHKLMAKIFHNQFNQVKQPLKQKLNNLPCQQQRHCRQRLSRRANREVPSGRPHRRGLIRSDPP